MRIVTLLPSATDIVAALGAGDDLVGVSHSCSPKWEHLPALTSTIIDYTASAATIDAQVKNAGAPLYMLDVELLKQLKPDVIISQSLCDVCAVATGDVEEAVDQPPARGRAHERGQAVLRHCKERSRYSASWQAVIDHRLPRTFDLSDPFGGNPSWVTSASSSRRSREEHLLRMVRERRAR